MHRFLPAHVQILLSHSGNKLWFYTILPTSVFATASITSPWWAKKAAHHPWASHARICSLSLLESALFCPPESFLSPQPKPRLPVLTVSPQKTSCSTPTHCSSLNFRDQKFQRSSSQPGMVPWATEVLIVRKQECHTGHSVLLPGSMTLQGQTHLCTRNVTDVDVGHSPLTKWWTQRMS